MASNHKHAVKIKTGHLISFYCKKPENKECHFKGYRIFKKKVWGDPDRHTGGYSGEEQSGSWQIDLEC